MKIKSEIDTIIGGWSSWTPSFTWSGGTPTFTVPHARYLKIGKTVYILFRISITALNGATGSIVFSLPENRAAMDANEFLGTGRETQFSGRLLCVETTGSASTASLTHFDRTGVFTGNHLVSAKYEAA